MSSKDTPRLVVAVSSRALFDLEEENKVFEEKGLKAFRDFQAQTWNVPANPGVAFPMVKKLLALNDLVGERIVDVVVVSKNDPSCGLRVLNSCEKYGLSTERAIFTGGGPRTPYLKVLGCNLFLTADQEAARRALEADIPAACVGAGPEKKIENDDGTIRIAFDGDSVLFSDESERIYKSEGLHAFRHNETVNSEKPLAPGPMHSLFSVLHDLKVEFPQLEQKFRLALVTARGIEAAGRAMHTINSWGMQVDEACFLSGSTKAPILETFRADFFFDDQKKHIDLANEKVPSGHVIWGVANEKKIDVTDQPGVADNGGVSSVPDDVSRERQALSTCVEQVSKKPQPKVGR